MFAYKIMQDVLLVGFFFLLGGVVAGMVIGIYVSVKEVFKKK